MDEMAKKINEILNDPEQLRQIQNMASMLGISQGNEKTASSAIPNESIPASDSGILTKLAPLLNLNKNDDETICFLMALRPLLSPERRKKTDEAIKILRVLKLFSLLKSSDILSSLF